MIQGLRDLEDLRDFRRFDLTDFKCLKDAGTHRAILSLGSDPGSGIDGFWLDRLLNRSGSKVTSSVPFRLRCCAVTGAPRRTASMTRCWCAR